MLVLVTDQYLVIQNIYIYIIYNITFASNYHFCSGLLKSFLSFLEFFSLVSHVVIAAGFWNQCITWHIEVVWELLVTVVWGVCYVFVTFPGSRPLVHQVASFWECCFFFCWRCWRLTSQPDGPTACKRAPHTVGSTCAPWFITQCAGFWHKGNRSLCKPGLLFFSICLA